MWAPCGTGNGPPVWQAGTNNIDMFGAEPNSEGHDSVTPNFFIADTNPLFEQHPLTNPVSSTLIAQTSCSPC